MRSAARGKTVYLRREPLARIALAEDNLLFFYADGRARLWDVKTLEFWRSMGRETAAELVLSGSGSSAWFDVRLDTPPPPRSRLVSGMYGAGDAGECAV